MIEISPDNLFQLCSMESILSLRRKKKRGERVKLIAKHVIDKEQKKNRKKCKHTISFAASIQSITLLHNSFFCCIFLKKTDFDLLIGPYCVVFKSLEANKKKVLDAVEYKSYYAPLFPCWRLR